MFLALDVKLQRRIDSIAFSAPTVVACRETCAFLEIVYTEQALGPIGLLCTHSAPSFPLSAGAGFLVVAMACA